MSSLVSSGELFGPALLHPGLTPRVTIESQLPATFYALGILLTYVIAPQSQVLYFWLMQQCKVYIISILGELSPMLGTVELISAVLNYRVVSKPIAEVRTSEYTVSADYS